MSLKTIRAFIETRLADRAVLIVQNNLETLNGNATVKHSLYCISFTYWENLIGSKTNPPGTDHCMLPRRISRVYTTLTTSRKTKLTLAFSIYSQRSLCLCSYCYSVAKLTFVGGMLHGTCKNCPIIGYANCARCENRMEI